MEDKDKITNENDEVRPKKRGRPPKKTENVSDLKAASGTESQNAPAPEKSMDVKLNAVPPAAATHETTNYSIHSEPQYHPSPVEASEEIARLIGDDVSDIEPVITADVQEEPVQEFAAEAAPQVVVPEKPSPERAAPERHGLPNQQQDSKRHSNGGNVNGGNGSNGNGKKQQQDDQQRDRVTTSLNINELQGKSMLELAQMGTELGS